MGMDAIKGLGKLRHPGRQTGSADLLKKTGDHKTYKKVTSGIELFPFEQVDFYEAGTGLAGVILILPAVLAPPAPAEHALAELRDRVGRVAEIAHVLSKTAGILRRRFPLIPHHRDLFFEFTDAIWGNVTFWRFPSGPVLFPECQVVPPATPGGSASRTQSSSVHEGVLRPVRSPGCALL